MLFLSNCLAESLKSIRGINLGFCIGNLESTLLLLLLLLLRCPLLYSSSLLAMPGDCTAGGSSINGSEKELSDSLIDGCFLDSASGQSLHKASLEDKELYSNLDAVGFSVGLLPVLLTDEVDL